MGSSGKPSSRLQALVTKYEDRINKSLRYGLRGVESKVPSTLIQTGKKNELGRGVWGVVYRTSHPRWVWKITADPDEGKVVSAILNNPSLRNHAGITYYAGIWRMPDKFTFKQSEYDVYIVLREDITPRGVPPEESLSASERKAESYLRVVQRHSEDLNDWIERHAEEYALISARQVGQICGLMQKVRETSLIGDFMIRFLSKTGGALADVHLGNIGFREQGLSGSTVPGNVKKNHKPNSTQWVILDPGNSSIQVKTPISMLRNPCYMEDIPWVDS